MVDERKPDVVVDFVFENGLFYIVVINIGDAPAYAVTVLFNHEIRGLGGTKNISNMPLFQRIEFMPPQKRISTFLDTSASYFTQQQPNEIEATIKFADRDGKKYENIIKHNLNIYLDIGYIYKVE